MRPILLLLVALLTLAASPVQAQSGDPGDLFVNAYMAVQQGEKSEQSGNFKAAMSKLRYAAGVLDQISGKYPTWQPPIVEYRKKRTSEAIQRVQEKLARFGPGKAEAGEAMASPDGGALPRESDDKPLLFENAEPLPGLSLAPTNTSPATRKMPERGPDNDLFEEAAQRMKKLQADLREARAEAEQAQREKTELAQKLEDSTKARAAAEQKQQVLQTRANNTEAALMKALSDGKADAEKIRALLADSASLKKEMRDAKLEADADLEYRRQLDERYKTVLGKVASLTQERDASAKLSGDAPGKIQAIQKQLEQTKKERDDIAAKLEKTQGQLALVTQQRDEALTQVSKLKEAQKQVDKLVSDNASLMAKLADAEKSITQFKAEGVKKDEEIATLKKEVSTVKDQLAAAKRESADYQRQMADMQMKLEESGKQLAAAKAENAASAAEKKKMMEENTMLRGIVLRQQKQEAVRAQTKKLVLGELAKLEVNSKTLLKQIDFLSQPVVKLTPKERSLFKKPELQISDSEISMAMPKAEDAESAIAPDATPAAEIKPAEMMATAEVKSVPAEPAPTPTLTEKKPESAPDKTAPVPPPPSSAASPSPLELASAKPSTTLPAQSPAPAAAANANEQKPADTIITGNDTTANVSGAPNVPTALLPLAKEGKEQFERGNYLDAEKTYRKILAKAPNNLYTLSNLGVVLFRAGKFKPAEEAFKKAIQIAPEDGFSHCTLGIVYYSVGKYDEAVGSLTKALAVNPRNATAHNYLGITASQKGWQEAAQKELETATNLDPNYADAHFNLAVVFATQTPPNKEMAQKYYKRAIELGAEPDSALEALIK